MFVFVPFRSGCGSPPIITSITMTIITIIITTTIRPRGALHHQAELWNLGRMETIYYHICIYIYIYIERERYRERERNMYRYI